MAFLRKKELLIPVKQAKLACYVFESDNAPLIVLHGGPGLGCQYLLPQMAELGKFSNALFYDQRGAGQSIAENNDWQANPFETYVRDVDQLRKALGLKTISILAHSWGNILASMYILAYPQHVDKIVHLNPVPLSSVDYLEFVKHRSQIVDSHKDELDQIRGSLAFKNGDPDIVEKFYRIYFKNYFAKPELESTLTLKMSPEAAINNFKIYDLFYQYTVNNPFDLYPGLALLNLPTLIVACDKDIIPIQYMEHLHKTIASSKFALLKNCGHFPYIDQPELLFNTLKEFLC